MNLQNKLLSYKYNASLKKPIKPDIQLLDYVYSTGSQIVDTGIKGGVNAEYEIKINFTTKRNSDWDQFFAGTKPRTVPKLYCWGSQNKIDAQGAGGSITILQPVNDNVHVIKYTKDSHITRNGINYGYLGDAKGLGWGDGTWWLFTSHDEPQYKASMKLYYLKMWTDGVLVRDFKPCISPDNGKPCLYDAVSKTFFYSTTPYDLHAGNPI